MKMRDVQQAAEADCGSVGYLCMDPRCIFQIVIRSVRSFHNRVSVGVSKDCGRRG